MVEYGDLGAGAGAVSSVSGTHTLCAGGVPASPAVHDAVACAPDVSSPAVRDA